MLNPFPTLLAFGLIAPVLLRLMLGLIFIHFGSKLYGAKDYRKLVAIAEILGGIALVIGFGVQIVSLVFALGLAYMLVLKINSKNFLTDGINYYLILFVVAVSLVFLGAGFFAVDMPL